jgi:hypothetical protein
LRSAARDGSIGDVVVLSRTEHRFSWWHQGVMLFDRTYAWSDDFSEYTEAASGAWLGQSHSRAVTFVSPGGAVFSSDDAALIVELLDGPPELPNEADSVGEFDLLVPSGELVMEESGGGGGETVLPLPPGEWRARWSGFGQTAAEAREYTEQSEGDPRPDHYLLQLWPLRLPGRVVILRGY